MLLTRQSTCLLVLAVALRIFAQVLLGAYAHPTTWEYEDIAGNLLAGRGYTYVVDQTPYVAAVSSPLYVLLTAAVYAVTAHTQAVMLVLGALFGGVTASLAGWLGTRTFRSEAGWVAGVLVAIDPALLVYSAELHPLSLDALAFLAVICACVALPSRPGWPAAALVGITVGVAALTRTTVLSLIPIVVLWANHFRGLRLASVATAALVGAALVAYSPWPVRNSLLLGQFVPGSSESTEWLWRGTNPNATGSSYTPDGRTMLQAAPADFQARVGASSEAERITVYRDTALTYISQHPSDAARLYALKLKAFWLGSETTGQQYPPAWTTFYEAWFALMLLFALYGLVLTWRDDSSRPVAILIVASLALITASQAIFYVEGRHRMAVEPLVLVLAGVGISQAALLVRVPKLAPLRLYRARNDLR